MAAALHVMRQRGFFGATASEIAERAGVPEAAIWKHFGSKYDLCLSVLASPFEEPPVIRSLPQAVGVRDPREVLVDVVSWVRNAVDRLGGVYAGALQHPETRDLVVAFTRNNSALLNVLESLADYVEAEQQAGRIPGRVDPAMFAEILIGSTVHHAQTVALYGEDLLPAPGGTSFEERLVEAMLA